MSMSLARPPVVAQAEWETLPGGHGGARRVRRHCDAAARHRAEAHADGARRARLPLRGPGGRRSLSKLFDGAAGSSSTGSSSRRASRDTAGQLASTRPEIAGSYDSGPSLRRGMGSGRKASMSGRLDGRVAVVVGGGQTPGETIGNGRATAITFAREGAKVVVVDRDLGSAEETV